MEILKQALTDFLEKKSNIDLKEIKQMEKHIIPKFVKFNNTEFVMPSVYMAYNRGLLVNSDEIIKNYKEG